jgi:hypothetical protein
MFEVKLLVVTLEDDAAASCVLHCPNSVTCFFMNNETGAMLKCSET